MMDLHEMDLLRHKETMNEQLARYGVRFGIYRNNVFHEQLFPYDPIPRVIDRQNADFLEKGLAQRVMALNAFILDIYGKKQIIHDGVVPEEFVFAGSGYLAQCEGMQPPKGVCSHISGIDLVLGKDGEWYVLEDNLRIPSGASYPMIARELERRCSPKTFRQYQIEDNRDYAALLRGVMDYVSTEGVPVILTPGRYNAAYFEHSYLAEKTGARLVSGQDLFVEDNILYRRTFDGGKERVGAVYRRLGDDFLDPLNFRPDSLIGVPHIFDAFRAGNVAIMNTPGNGVADDKGIYYFVPKMVRYYLNEEPILQNAPTFLPFYGEDMKYVLEHFDELVLKDVAEAGGYGVRFANTMTAGEKEDFIRLLKKEPRRFIAQRVVDFQEIEICSGDGYVPRKADLRAFVLYGEKPVVWKSGLTRFTTNPDSYIVNSSQGGGFKDTWVLSQ